MCCWQTNRMRYTHQLYGSELALGPLRGGQSARPWPGAYPMLRGGAESHCQSGQREQLNTFDKSMGIYS
jgi:hypothetical protein